MCGRERNSRGIPRLWIAAAPRNLTPRCPRVLKTPLYDISPLRHHIYTRFPVANLHKAALPPASTTLTALLGRAAHLSRLDREHVGKTIDNSHLSRIWSFLTMPRVIRYIDAWRSKRKLDFPKFYFAFGKCTIEDKYWIYTSVLYIKYYLFLKKYCIRYQRTPCVQKQCVKI